jgi:Cu(I)/Ag(I) efflux system periplasmic protein CusF
MSSLSRRLLVLATLATAGPLALAQSPQIAGEVTKIDKPQARITLRHGEIKHLDMPPMNMAFRVRDAKSLDGLAVGDRVRFTVEKIDGNFTVTSLSKGP